MKQLFFLSVLIIVMGACCSDASRARYEEARQLMAQGDAPEALEHFRRAADQTDNDSLLAQIYGDMGQLLLYEGLQEQAFRAYQQAFAACERCADSAGLAYALFDLGNVCRARECDDSCQYYYNQSLRLARAQGDSQLVTDIHCQLAGYYLWHKDYERARSLLQPVLTRATSAAAGWRFMAADLFHHAGPADSARLYCQSLLGEDDVVLRQMGHKWLAEALLAEGRPAEAAANLEQYELLTDTLMEETDTEAMHRVSALYDYSRHQQQSARLQRQVIVAVALLVVLACLLLATLLYLSRRRLQYRLKLQQLEHLLADYRRRDAATTERQQQVLTGTPVSQRIEQLLADSRHPSMTDEDWRILEATIEKTHPGFVERLQAFRHFTPQEMHVNLLLKLGIPPAGIAQLTARAKQSVSSVRSRLYEKVFGQKGSPAQWDEFIQSL